MENKFEQKESLVEADTITGQELLDLIYQGQSLPQDSRFLRPEKGGVFKYFFINDLIQPHQKKEDLFYPVVKVNGKIVAICSLQKNPYKENLYWITGASTDPAYRGRRYASIALEEAFRFAREKGLDLEASTYSEEGLEKLKSVCRRLAIQYGVEFRESGY